VLAAPPGGVCAVRNFLQRRPGVALSGHACHPRNDPCHPEGRAPRHSSHSRQVGRTSQVPRRGSPLSTSARRGSSATPSFPRRRSPLPTSSRPWFSRDADFGAARFSGWPKPPQDKGAAQEQVYPYERLKLEMERGSRSTRMSCNFSAGSCVRAADCSSLGPGLTLVAVGVNFDRGFRVE